LDIASVAEALTKSKPKSLTNLDLAGLGGSFKPLSSALLACPSLTHLSIVEFDKEEDRDILPVVLILHCLPLTKLTLSLKAFTDESIEYLLFSLSQQSAILQDLTLGTLSPQQLQLVADALPSFSSLLSFGCDTEGYFMCQHEPAHLALFSALASSSLRWLSLLTCSFRLATLEACLNELPHSQLTRCHIESPIVFPDNFDAKFGFTFYKKNRFPSIDIATGVNAFLKRRTDSASYPRLGRAFE
jgi:hypothetical protein